MYSTVINLVLMFYLTSTFHDNSVNTFGFIERGGIGLKQILAKLSSNNEAKFIESKLFEQLALNRNNLHFKEATQWYRYR